MATKTLYVGNLSYSTTTDDLQSHFAAYNPSNARIIEGRGFGFIDIDADKIRAECRDGILALYLPRAERDKPRSITVS